MLARDNWVFALIIFNINSALPHNVIHSIKDGKGSSPIVLLLNIKQRTGTIYDLDQKVTSNIEVTTNDVADESDNGAYLLYHLLRTTQENEDLDESTNRTFEKTKDMLRAALRSRCNKLDRCVRRCVKKRYTCTVTCREEIDVYDVCRQPVCGKSCWGKTMPPSWLK
ncbi:unnamed protein product [Pieris macdunnoughi]|uniref:Uncharacterized protein n=1 Tax=Pieris macdunnoughi TaxID=345717 RepID=A0A821VHF1_9NEOP|nr:unnamed protein product [Pieris macdunnoughi]